MFNKSLKILLLFVLLVVFSAGVEAFSCGQETANVSTVCGGLSSGVYNEDEAPPVNTTHWRDGDWDTYTVFNLTGAETQYSTPPYYLYVNYTIPKYATNDSYLTYKSTQVWDGSDYHEIKVLPFTTNFADNSSYANTCWNYAVANTNITELRYFVQYYAPGWKMNVECYNGSWAALWNTADPYHFNFGPGSGLYEENMTWNISYSESDVTAGSVYAELTGVDSYIYANVTKPDNVFTATLEYKDEDEKSFVVVPDGCFDYNDTMEFRVVVSPTDDDVLWQCKNVSGYQTIASSGEGTTALVYDFNLYWDSPSTEFISWNYPSWYNVTKVTLLASGVSEDNLTDVTLRVNGVDNKVLKGDLVGTELHTTKFSDGESSRSLFFTDTTRTQTVYFDVSSSPFLLLNLSLSSFAADPEPLDYYNIFREDSNISAANSTGADYPYFTLDDLETNRLDWSYGGGADVNSYISASDYWMIDVNAEDPGPYSYYEEEGFVVNNDWNVNDYDKIGVYVTSSVAEGESSSCIGDHGSGSVYLGVTSDITTGLPFVEAADIHSGKYSTSGTGVSGYIFLERVSEGSTSWKVYFSDTYIQTITIPEGEQYLVGKARAYTTRHNACGSPYGRAIFYWHDVLMGGFGAEELGNNAYNTSWSVMSEVIHNPTENITAAYFVADEVSDNVFSDMTFYLSPDNGTTWEETDNPSYHLFAAEGNALRWLANGTSTSTDGNYGVNVVNIEITTSNPENLTYDLGADDTYEYNYSGVFNVSENVTINNTDSHLLYFENICGDVDSCVVPLEIISEANGGLVISSVKYVTDVNPIVLDNNLSTSANLTYSFTGLTIGTSNITFSSYHPYFWGDLDSFPVYIERETGSGTKTLETILLDIRYSPYTTVKLSDYADFRPTSFVQYNISPYGQDASSPYWNFTALSTNHTTRFFMNMYEDLNACVTLRAADTYAQDNNVIELNATGQNIVNLTGGSSNGVWAYLDYVSCTAGFALDFVTNTLCEDCVQTYDYDEWDGVS